MMSGSFTGFSEDDIRKLHHKQPDKKPQVLDVVATKVQKQENTRINNKHELRKKILNEKISLAKYTLEPIEENAKLTKPHIKDNQSIADITTELSSAGTSNSEENSNLNKVVEKDSSNPTENVEKKRKINLEEFPARQKLIEEQNKKRKELLVNALAAKSKQTKEEAKRINEIQKELQKLDDLLSYDVKFLRKRIEVASFEFMEAQKKYYKMEREYLDAKLYLHQTLEKKELLTEHLFAIIEKNEERKAEKLNELLFKLNMTESAKDISEAGTR